MISIRKILCPTDFSELSAHATQYAASLAEQYHAELHVLHVVDEAYQYWTAMGPESMPIGPSAEQILESARLQMDRWRQERFADVKVDLICDVLVGRPFVEISHYARDKQIDLIVLGTHGRSGLTHMLLGSVTEKVVRKAPCPVLTVRDPSQPVVLP